MSSTYDAGDPEQVKDEAKKKLTATQQQNEDLHFVLSTYRGRAVMWRLLEGCGVFSSSYRGDVHAMVYQEGQRKIGLTWIDNIRIADPDAYVTMQREAIVREKQKAVAKK